MASDGVLKFQTTSNRHVEEVLEIPVYRENTKGRTNTVTVNVPSALLAPPHLYFHPLVLPEPAYYEVVGPEIFRIGLKVGAKLPIHRDTASPVNHDLKLFEYIVMGDTGEAMGLGAPYDEEECTTSGSTTGSTCLAFGWRTQTQTGLPTVFQSQDLWSQPDRSSATRTAKVAHYAGAHRVLPSFRLEKDMETKLTRRTPMPSIPPSPARPFTSTFTKPLVRKTR